MKTILKKTIIIIVLFCILTSSLFSGFVLASEVPLNQERAGNYAANFAINFYENWSSVGVEEGSSVQSNSASVNGNYSWVWPIDESVVTSKSEFGPRSLDGVHKGMDFAAPKGTPIYSSSSGTVKVAFSGCSHNYSKSGGCGCGGNYGNNVRIDCGNGVAIIYGHMTDVMVTEGETVEQGQQIGTVGSTGWSTGNHLHFEFITNDIQGLSSDQYISRTSILGYNYSVDPRIYVEDGANITSTSTYTSDSIIRGEVKTEYDENATADDVEESDDTYLFSNKSWIEFVFKKSLTMTETIVAGNTLNTTDGIFDNTEEIFGEALEDTTDIIDIASLVTEGSVLPGDVLYIDNGAGGGEFVLYVGGAKIIYATPPEVEVGVTGNENVANSALKYEYLQYYLKRLEDKLLEGHEDEEDYAVPLYGVTEIYRINADYLQNNKTQEDANLIFNGKGYYSYTRYDGTPKEITYLGSESINIFKWIFDLLAGIFEFLLSLITYIIRMQILGWANIVEGLIESVVLGISGHTGSFVEAIAGASGTSASGDRISVDSIFFNQIPILDANFFDFETAGGHSLKIEKEIQATASGREAQIVEVADEENIVYQLRKNLVTWYSIIRNASIAMLLFVLIYLGIRLLITASSEKKAETKKLLSSWVVSFVIIFFLHYYMYGVLYINNTLVSVCNNIGQTIAGEVVYGEQSEEGEETEETQTMSQEELNLYDAVRTKAYAFSYKEGVPATIIYIYLIYLLIRFLLIYAKRYLTIYILAIMGSFMGVKHAFERIAGKKTTSLNKWLKEFAFNVLLQTVHAFIYVIYMGVALNMASTNLAGFFICLVILNFMVKADKIIMKIFGLNKANSLADVDTPESYMALWAKVTPVWFIHKKLFTGVKEGVFGKKGIWSEIQYSYRGFDNYKDAYKDAEKRKFKKIGDKWEKKYNNAMAGSWIGNMARGSKVKPIRSLAENMRKRRLANPNMNLRYLSGNRNISHKTKKSILSTVESSKKLKRRQFTRKVGFVKDIFVGFGGMTAAVALAIDNPTDGMAMFMRSKKAIDKHRTLRGAKRMHTKYGAVRGTALNSEEKRRAQESYDLAEKTFIKNQDKYDKEMIRLRRLEAAETNPDAKKAITEQISQLEKTRQKERDNELFEMKIAKIRLETDSKLEMRKLVAKEKYERALDIHADNQYEFEQEIQRLKELEANETDPNVRKAIADQIAKLEKARQEAKAKELDEIRAAYEESVKTDKEYKTASHTVAGRKLANTLGNLTGVSALDDMAAAETYEAHKEKDKASKTDKKLAEMAKAAEAEEELRNAVKQLREAYKKKNEELAESDEERKHLEETIRYDLSETNKASRKANVSAALLRKTINEYLYNTRKEKITSEDVDQVLERLQKALKSRHSDVEFTDDDKKRIKEKMEQAMVDENKGLGYEGKDAAALLRNIIGSEVQTNTEIRVDEAFDTPEIVQLHEKMRSLIGKIYTINEVSRIKQGSALINISKIINDAEKE